MSPTTDGASADLQQTVADLQRQLAEARAERDEFEAQKAALAEVLGIINSSPSDLTPVFDAILEQAHRICGADLGCLAVYEGKQFRALATHNYPPEYAALVRQPYGAQASVYARLVNGERYIHIPDVVAVPTPGLEDAIRCPSSGRMRLFERFRSGGSGSSGLTIKLPAGDAASGDWRWSGA